MITAHNPAETDIPVHEMIQDAIDNGYVVQVTLVAPSWLKYKELLDDVLLEGERYSVAESLNGVIKTHVKAEEQAPAMGITVCYKPTTSVAEGQVVQLSELVADAGQLGQVTQPIFPKLPKAIAT